MDCCRPGGLGYSVSLSISLFHCLVAVSFVICEGFVTVAIPGQIDGNLEADLQTRNDGERGKREAHGDGLEAALGKWFHDRHLHPCFRSPTLPLVGRLPMARQNIKVSQRYYWLGGGLRAAGRSIGKIPRQQTGRERREGTQPADHSEFQRP